MTNQRHRGVIILGFPRSGTTLLRRFFDAHPNVCCPGEAFLVRATARFLQSEQISYGIDYGVLGGLTAIGFEKDDILSRLRDLAFGFYDDVAQRQRKQRWVAKTAVDSFYIDDIERLYGDHVYFICVVRHGLDVVCSFKEFSDELEGYIQEIREYVSRYARPLEAFAHAWLDVNLRLRKFLDNHPQNAIMCRYEDLILSPDETMSGLMRFIGEDWKADIVGQALASREVVGLGDWKTYGKTTLDTTSIDRWQDLSEATQARLAPIVNPGLAAFNYRELDTHAQFTPGDAMRKYELAMMVKATSARTDAP